MTSQQQGPRVLVVDDQPEIRSFMSDALGVFGYQVGVVGDADEAFALVGRTHFDLVMSDLRLPGLTGWDFAARLRSLAPALPLIVMTGSAPDDDELRRVRDAGIAVLHKPVGLPQLQSALSEALGKQCMTGQTTIVAFREVNTPTAWCVEVLVGGVVAGHIYRGEGEYRYFEGPLNDVTWSFADLDLERLKARIRATVE
jgi:CheY-like chemotaxis protein